MEKIGLLLKRKKRPVKRSVVHIQEQTTVVSKGAPWIVDPIILGVSLVMYKKLDATFPVHSLES